MNIVDGGAGEEAVTKYRTKKRTYTKEWQAANPDKVRSHIHKWREKYPEKWQAQLDRYKERYPDKGKINAQKKREAMATRPRPKHCELCFKVGPVVYDHDHQTDKFRSWICGKHNTALGLCGDDPALLRRMADLIEEHKRLHANQV